MDIKSIKSRRIRIASLVRKELSTLFKDKISMVILFVIPVIIILTVGMGKIRFINQQVNVFVIDYDNTQKSHEFIETLKHSNLTVTSNWDHPEMNISEFRALAEKLLPTNKLAAYIIIHKGFEDDLIVNRSTKLTIYVDGIDFVSKIMAEMEITLGLTNYQLDNMVFERDVFYFPEFRPELNLNNLLQLGAPGMLSIILFSSMNLVTSQAIVGDTPLKRLLTTPIYRSEVVIGKTIAYTLISVFQIILALIMLIAFKVPFFGLFVDAFIVMWLCSLTGITMGIFFSSISKTRLQAAQMFLFAFMVMLIITSVLRNPMVLPFLPLEQTQVALSNVMYRGFTLSGIWDRLLYLSMDSAIFFFITLIYMKKKREFV